MHDTRIALYTKLFEGRRAAIANFLRKKYGPSLWNEVEDVVQDAYLKGRASFSPERAGAFNTWIIFCAMSAAMDRLKQHGRRWRGYAALSAEPEPETHFMGAVRAPQAAIETVERALTLTRFFEKLPKIFLETILLLLDGMKYDEIAAKLGVSRGTVMSRLHRAKKYLPEAREVVAA